MASVTARLPPPPLMALSGMQPLFGTPRKLAVFPVRERRCNPGGIARCTGKGSETSIVKSVQNAWDKSEDQLGLIGLGFAGVVAFWASINLVAAIDKLPVIPSFLELVGILFSSWFTYRYLLFKPDREELSRSISKSIADILEK